MPSPWNVPYETAAFEAVSLILGSRKERRWWIDGLSSGADSDSLDKEQRAHHPSLLSELASVLYHRKMNFK